MDWPARGGETTVGTRPRWGSSGHIYPNPAKVGSNSMELLV